MTRATVAPRVLSACALTACVLSASALGCGKSDGTLEGAAVSARPKAAVVRPKEAVYDANGQLLGSGVRVAWLELPRGFSPRPKGLNADVAYEAHDIPAARVRDYLAARMLTGSADEIGAGAVYHGAMPPDGAADAIRFDVSVLEIAPKGSVLLLLSPVTFPHVKPLSDSQARTTLAQEQRNAE